jgi:hypothetical protein
MTGKEFSELLNEVPDMTASEIADVIMFEDMTGEQADAFMAAIPAELVSAVMSAVE